MLLGSFFKCGLFAILVLAGTYHVVADDSLQKPATRTFRFDYGATLTKLQEGTRVRVWLPMPREDEYQHVECISSNLPAASNIAADPTYGNKILFFESAVPASGEVTFNTTYRITRSEVRNLVNNRSESVKLTDRQRKLFLSPSRKIPLVGKPLALLRDTELPRDPLALSRVLYDRVDSHVKYDKSQPGYGNGDVNWVCDSRFGNCTDFHSLFISFSRSRGIPARFEIGFPLPPDRGAGTVGGYHCWAFFHTERQGWMPVDISEADKHPELKEYYFGNLTENRVTFTTGRDIDLVPQQAGEPLNYFVYPYAEVNDQPLPKQHIKLAFSYDDETS